MATFADDLFTATVVSDTSSYNMSTLHNKEETARVVKPIIQDLLKSMKEKAPEVPPKLAKRLAESDIKEALRAWKDGHNLDLIHHGILNRNSAILEVVLKLFPDYQAPSSTPYAHLAAYIGATGCLKAVLAHRSGDFFKATEEEHMFRVPEKLHKQIKKEAAPRRGSNCQILIEKIRNICSQEDDKGQVTFSRITDREINDLLEEIQQLERDTNTERKNKGHIDHMALGTMSSLPDVAIKHKFRKKIEESKRRNPLHLPSIHSSQTSSISTSGRSVLGSNASSGNREYYNWGAKKITKIRNFHLPLGKRTEIPSPDTVVEDYKPNPFLNKTPLVLAAEQGNIEAVQLIVQLVIMKQCRVVDFKEPLTLCTKTNNPEAIAVLLDHKYSMEDLQFATITALRELKPECLTALMSVPEKSRDKLFDGTNFFHLLYTQSICSDSEYKFDLLPQMTRILLLNKENVNDCSVPGTFPLYTLISCAFKIRSKKLFYYQQCLEILLEAKGNPHFAEGEHSSKSKKPKEKTWGRDKYHSAFNCIFSCVCDAFTQTGGENIDMTKLFMKSFILRITRKDETPRQIRTNILFEYMENINVYGLDASILRCLLRYGANPDHKLNDKYVVNIYFDRLLEHLQRFEVCNSTKYYIRELEMLMRLCDAMSQSCLREAVRVFLDEHLLTTPIRALPITRYFCYLADKLTSSPRSLKNVCGQYIWVHLCQRNDKIVKQLPADPRLHSLILP